MDDKRTFWHLDGTLDIETSGNLLTLRFAGIFEPDTIRALFGEAAAIVRQEGKQWLAMTDFRNVKLRTRDPSIISFMIEYTRGNALYVARSAAVVRGGSPILFVAERVFAMAKRPITVFRSTDEALSFLQASHRQ